MHVIEKYDISELEPYLREILLEDQRAAEAEAECGTICIPLSANELDETEQEPDEFAEFDDLDAQLAAIDADAAEFDDEDVEVEDVEDVEVE
jgi:hypothetical protein